jgi:hypothetical protein
MKKIKYAFSLFLLIVCHISYSQKIQSYNGDYDIVINVDNYRGNVKYSYTEDSDGKRLYQGLFNFNGEINNAEVTEGKPKYSIIGQYKNGLKNGRWTYIFTDIWDGVKNERYLSRVDFNIYKKQTLSGYYKDGLIDGVWTFTGIQKQVAKTPYQKSNGVYTQLATKNGTMSFKNGFIVGKHKVVCKNTENSKVLSDYNIQFETNQEGILINDFIYKGSASNGDNIVKTEKYQSGFLIQESSKSIATGKIYFNDKYEENKQYADSAAKGKGIPNTFLEKQNGTSFEDFMVFLAIHNAPNGLKNENKLFIISYQEDLSLKSRLEEEKRQRLKKEQKEKDIIENDIRFFQSALDTYKNNCKQVQGFENYLVAIPNGRFKDSVIFLLQESYLASSVFNRFNENHGIDYTNSTRISTEKDMEEKTAISNKYFQKYPDGCYKNEIVNLVNALKSEQKCFDFDKNINSLILRMDSLLSKNNGKEVINLRNELFNCPQTKEKLRRYGYTNSYFLIDNKYAIALWLNSNFEEYKEIVTKNANSYIQFSNEPTSTPWVDHLLSHYKQLKKENIVFPNDEEMLKYTKQYKKSLF